MDYLEEKKLITIKKINKQPVSVFYGRFYI